jgi:multidrug efflux pump subunit AcrA (membrane-fusion protein)
VLVKVKFVDTDPRILPEMSAMVAFLSEAVPEGERKPRTAVSPSAVAERDGKKVVFVVSDDRVVQTPVTTGAAIGDFVEIKSGVKPGDKVVLKPSPKLKDGSRIKVAEK